MPRHELEEYLGTGVDIFNADPWALSFKTRMLDDPITEETPIARGQYREISGDSLLEISHGVGVEAGLKGGYAGVTASVKTKFKRSEERSERTHFLKIAYTHSGTRIVVEGGKEQIRAQFNASFREAIESSDPDELIKEYGTHLVRKIILGGKAEYFVRSSASSSMTTEEFEVAARAKYDSQLHQRPWWVTPDGKEAVRPVPARSGGNGCASRRRFATEARASIAIEKARATSRLRELTGEESSRCRPHRVKPAEV
jgi:MAC/Perforin domain